MSPQSGMSAQMSEVCTPGVAQYPIPFSRSRVRAEKALQYRLNVVAADVAGVVAGIGGWLFDRAMAGWRVAVTVGRCADRCGPDCADCRALRILGLKAVGVGGLWCPEDEDEIAVTAIDADHSDDLDLAALPNRGGAVVFFGSRAPDCLATQLDRVDYRPSAAALAFKSHASAILGAESVSAAETVFRFERSAGLLDDLVAGC